MNYSKIKKHKFKILTVAILIIIYITGITLKKESPKLSSVEIGKADGNKPIIINYDTEYSFKDFTKKSLKEIDLNGKTIYASVFMQEIPDSHIFPEDMRGVTFVNSNLDNVYIPPGNTVIGGTRRRFQVQNDGNDWIIDSKNKPIEPINKEQYLEIGLSIDPKDLPKNMMTENIFEKTLLERNKNK